MKDRNLGTKAIKPLEENKKRFMTLDLAKTSWIYQKHRQQKKKIYLTYIR